MREDCPSVTGIPKESRVTDGGEEEVLVCRWVPGKTSGAPVRGIGVIQMRMSNERESKGLTWWSR